MAKPHPRLMVLAVGASALLAALAAGLFYYASQTATGPERGDIHKVTVGRKDCNPMDFTLPAGRATFEIHNASDRPIEWEILDGVMVVEERENIAPGFHSLLTARLKPGEYQITCGLLSNPRGRLVVTPSAASEAERLAPPVTAFIGPLSEYKVYLAAQARELDAMAEALEQAIRADDADAARAAWLAARLPYKRIEAVMDHLADLENAIDPLPDYLEGRESDPGFTGFHRIEYGLWGPGGDGLPPVAERFRADVAALKDRLREVRLAPGDLAGLAARQAGRIASGQIAMGEDRWAGTDLAEVEAALEGIAKPAGLMRPLLSEAAPDAAKAFDDALSLASAELDALKTPAGFPAHGDLGAAARERLTDAFTRLAAAIGTINPAIGLE